MEHLDEYSEHLGRAVHFFKIHYTKKNIKKLSTWRTLFYLKKFKEKEEKMEK